MSWFSHARKLLPSVRSYATLRDSVKRIAPEELYEPIFVEKREYPDYSRLYIRLQDYDYAPLERFQSYIHLIAKRFEFTIVDSYGVMATKEKIVSYRPASTIIASEIELKLYDRWLVLDKVPAIRFPIFLNLIRAHAPPGMRISAGEYTKEAESHRYIPDILLRQRQDELKSLDDPLVRKNLGWE